MHTGYNPLLVTLSIIIAVLASYAALDLGSRVRRPGGGRRPSDGRPSDRRGGVRRGADRRWAWCAGAALAMGGGIWSMHFIGMLAFEMSMPVAYAPLLTLLSLAIAVGITALAFAWVTLRGTGARSLLVAGPIMGFGVAAMHYTGMAAMRMPGDITFDPWLVALSVVIAVGAATAALWLTFRENRVWQKLAAACVMGLAVAGMHYTGMAAAAFSGVDHGQGAHHGMDAAAGPAGALASQQGLALAVAGVTFVILALAMLAASLDQRRTQRRLHDSEARFRSAVAAVDGVMWTTDTAGNLIGEQPGWQRISGQTLAQYRDGGWANALHPDDGIESARVWAASVLTGTPYEVEQRMRGADGNWRHYQVRAVPVRDGSGDILEWVGVHTDITERRRYEASLREARDAAEEASRAKSRFLANMSHELRTPLSAVIGYAEMLQEEAEDSGQQSLLADLAKIRSNAQHLLGLINDVLDLSKVEAEKMDVFIEGFDVADFARDAAATVEALVAKKNNRLLLDLGAADGGEGLGMASTDAVKLRQCLFNLIGNAAKFTEGGTITLRIRRLAGAGGDRLHFSVADTGIGMTPEQLGRLFQRFSQADETTTRRYGGTGLGLALTKAFASLLGGTVAVESRVGEGTTFTLDIPAAVPQQQPAAIPVPAAAPVDGGRGLVLVVDDEASQRELMARFLSRQGFAARGAADGRTGLSLARELRPTAILLDVMMPEMDGWAVLAALKKDPATRDTPVVMVSFAADQTLSASLGAEDSMPKPVDWLRLKEVLDRIEGGDVLVVDDDAEMRRRLRAVLTRHGLTVREAGDGEEALTRVRQARPALVLLDLTMPVMDGFAFMRSLRTLPGCAETPVVVLSARDVSFEEQALLLGAETVLRKGDSSLQEIAAEVGRLCLATTEPVGLP